MPLTQPDIHEKRTKGAWYNPTYYVAATVTNTTSATRRACDIYEEIESGAKAWTDFQLERANELRAIYQAATNDGGANVFKGAHVVLNDDCKWYYYWTSLIKGRRDRGYERWSSHYDKSRLAPNNQRHSHSANSHELQFEIYFPWNSIHMNWGCFLFGRYQSKGLGSYVTESKTWFQTEAHSSTRPGIGGTIVDPVAHIVTGAVPYFMTFKTMNVGPRGFSSYTESSPLIVDKPANPPTIIPDHQIPTLWEGMKVLGNDVVLVEAVDDEDVVPSLETSCGAKCVKCGKEHGRLPSVFRKWHECKVCGAIYCNSCGYNLDAYWVWAKKGERSCDRSGCSGKTKLFG